MEKRLREQQGEEEISMEEKIHPVYGLSNYFKFQKYLLYLDRGRRTRNSLYKFVIQCKSSILN
jgi:hypothetical protein